MSAGRWVSTCTERREHIGSEMVVYLLEGNDVTVLPGVRAAFRALEVEDVAMGDFHVVDERGNGYRLVLRGRRQSRYITAEPAEVTAEHRRAIAAFHRRETPKTA